MIEKFEKRSRSQLNVILKDLKKQYEELDSKLDPLLYNLDDPVFEPTLNEYNEIILRIEDVERELLHTDEDNI